MNRSPPRNLPRGAFLFVCLPRCARFRSARALSGPSKPRLRGTSRFRGIDDGEPIRDNHPIDQEGGDGARRAPRREGAARSPDPTSAPPTIRERIQMAEDTNYVTLEVAIDSSLYDNLIHAAANRGQSVSEFVESVLDREVEQALSETPVEVRDPQDEE